MQASTKKQVLFVGHQPALWDELRAQARRPDSPWQAAFARGGAEALVTLGTAPADAVVVDMHLPDLNGAQLLDEVMKRHPRVLRFILADRGDSQATLRCIGRAHQCLLKPSDAQTVSHALQRAFALDLWLPGETAQALLVQMHKLPSPPTVYFKVVKALQSAEGSLEDVGTLIAEDVVLTGKLLQLVNSAVFGLQMQVTNATDAVLYLGLEKTKALVLLAHTFSYFEGTKAAKYSMEELWRHSLATGRNAQCIARAEAADTETSAQAFTAGMLHDIGKLMLAANLPDPFRQALERAREQQVPLWEAEKETLGATHADIGASLLSIWGLPVPIVEAVALHHYPTRLFSKSFCALAAVHAANIFEHQAHPNAQEPGAQAVDLEYLKDLGCGEGAEPWRKLCAEGAQEG